ncbi:MAG: thioesterase family protein [Gammaproteobacteria bacterium]
MTDPMPAGAAALYRRDGESFVPEPNAAGPWDAGLQAGGSMAALLAHAAEAVPTPCEMVPVRTTIDLMRPAPMAPTQARTQVLREGRKLQLLRAELVQGDRVLASATVLRLRAGDNPADRNAPPPTPPALAPEAGELMDDKVRARNPMLMALEMRFVTPDFRQPGPATAWVRLLHPIVAGCANTPYMQVAICADLGAGMSSIVGFRDWTRINADVSIHLNRLPRGAWLAVDARTESTGNGIGQVLCTLFDREGHIGWTHQSVLIERRSQR